jgi:hypothetical protein
MQLLKVVVIPQYMFYVVNGQQDGLHYSLCEVTCQNRCTRDFQLDLTIADALSLLCKNRDDASATGNICYFTLLLLDEHTFLLVLFSDIL